MGQSNNVNGYFPFNQLPAQFNQQQQPANDPFFYQQQQQQNQHQQYYPNPYQFNNNRYGKRKRDE